MKKASLVLAVLLGLCSCGSKRTKAQIAWEDYSYCVFDLEYIEVLPQEEEKLKISGHLHLRYNPKRNINTWDPVTFEPIVLDGCSNNSDKSIELYNDLVNTSAGASMYGDRISITNFWSSYYHVSEFHHNTAQYTCDSLDYAARWTYHVIYDYYESFTINSYKYDMEVGKTYEISYFICPVCWQKVITSYERL